MPNVNKGAASTVTPFLTNAQRASNLTNLTTFANLPTGNDIPIGAFAYTSDQGPVWWSGAAWVGVSSASGSPSWSAKIAATFATTVNDANPVGWGPTVARIQATPASGGSTLNGLVSAGFTDGQTVMFINESTTDIFTFTSLSSACTTVADRFFCPLLGVALAAYSSVQVTRDNGYWTFS